MTKLQAQIWQLRKNSFDIGQEYGLFLKKNPKTLEIYKQVTKPEIDMRNMEAIYLELAPYILEELHGLADKLEVSLAEASALFSGYDVPKTKAMGCTTWIHNGVYTRNYDFSPLLYDGIFSLIQSKNYYASAGYNLQLIGRHDGMNEKGLAIGFHFVSNDGYTKGVSPWISCRMVLDQCATVEEAVRLLERIPHASCYNFSIGDKLGNKVAVETSPEKVKVRLGQDSLACTNHFLTEAMSCKNRAYIEGSLKRQMHLDEWNYPNMQQQEIFDYFRADNSPLFFTDYDNFFGTLHTFSYSFKDHFIMTCLAGSDEPLLVDFKKWVEGENISETELTGNMPKA
ncbi:C45 family peptidase [Niallia taxi]|uniref:C45 family autoproteolytic acyltransferase/hydolase n=1 Tax=Niallia taxi TaxID=2499688 RepID=UPI0023A95376|nr:C45 family peptidase [Niallia taxi]MDE5051124.1 C45 family autoproteolytic acyltransferase/hydrolase [Niallia taxi]WOD62423.1 C45 family peptidase [Niallia taxi]